MSTLFQQFRLNSSITLSCACKYYEYQYSLGLYILVARDFYYERPVVSLKTSFAIVFVLFACFHRAYGVDHTYKILPVSNI